MLLTLTGKMHFDVLLFAIFWVCGLQIPDLFHRSIESETSELFPWEENIKFYLYKSGMEKEMNISGGVDTSSLVETELRESDFIWLSLVALALSWGGPFVLSVKTEMLNDNIKETRELVGISDYSSFREFLKAIDFAGRFYEPEGVYKVKAPAKEIVESAKLRESKN